jgi:hypothetical protein
LKENTNSEKETAMKKFLTITLIALVLAAMPRPASAQLGSGVVYDPTNYHQGLLRYAQLIAHLKQLQATYMQIVNAYQLAQRMSQGTPNMQARYSATWSPWRYASAQDNYGNATPWINGVNSGDLSSVLAGFQKATSALSFYTPALLSAMPAGEARRIQSDIATIELIDGAAQNAMATIGAIRTHALRTTNTIDNIQNDSLSADPNLNTEVAVLNKVNATNVLSLQNAQDTNKLLVAILEQQTILSKQLRDSATNITNADINRRQNNIGLNQQLTGNIGQSLSSYKLP